MNVKFILVFLFGACEIADGHIIIYNTDGKHASPKQDLESEILDVRAQLIIISSQVNALIERVNSLESAGAKATEITTATTAKTTATTQTVSKCPDSWSTYNDSCYFIDSKDVNFQTAKNMCSQQHAHLVHLETREENAFLKSLLEKHFSEGLLYWIGMTDSETEGVWKMTGTDTIIPFTDWKGIEPENALTHPTGQDCAAFYRPLSYSWADINCFNRLARAVCEKNVTVLNMG
ncbi:perlucin-like protein [Mercenaria mercenaria]|uniref:perlucin-like protein n=1 Tax=Mercenaria mercenaria TaxID=6596 RepID=UPI00234F77FF|nr:perlucin-like protein [Mercenaria mercenaria]